MARIDQNSRTTSGNFGNASAQASDAPCADAPINLRGRFRYMTRIPVGKIVQVRMEPLDYFGTSDFAGSAGGGTSFNFPKSLLR